MADYTCCDRNHQRYYVTQFCHLLLAEETDRIIIPYDVTLVNNCRKTAECFGYCFGNGEFYVGYCGILCNKCIDKAQLVCYNITIVVL